ncbi:MAG: 7-cyano-7-deazaguanine synthase, partial [Bacillota bacterium]|nr:7-cyano-7-deazaguanine synthase [Bacillota bacterium]
LAACLAENLGAQMVICGFNREEAAIFPDNSSSFIEAVNSALSYSTRNHVFAKSFVQNMTKEDIVRQALLLDVNLDSLWSCYQDGDEPCGGCSSCITNQDAFRKVGIR